jgi:hypothetical protein
MSEILILSEPEFVGEFPVRKDLVITRRSAQYDDAGNCLHSNKSWYTYLHRNEFFLLRSCADCKLLLTQDGKESLSSGKFVALLADWSEHTEDQKIELIKKFEEINGVGDKMEKTLWQHWTQKQKQDKVVPKSLIYNELGFNVGQIVSLDILDYRDKDYTVSRIKEFIWKVDGIDFKATSYVLDPAFTCYVLDPSMELRSAEKKCWLFRLHEDFAFDEGFLAVVEDAMTSSFNIDDAGEVFIPILRSKLSTTNDLQEKRNIQRWMFQRNAKDEAGQDYLELLHVEQDNETGWFHLWRGIEIAIDRIFVI